MKRHIAGQSSGVASRMSTARDPSARADVAARLMAAGFVAAEDEADELLGAGGDLDALLARRLTGEPLEWIVGHADFCGLRLRVDPGVYVPRWHTQALALRAAERLPEGGVAIDLCTGCGAIAATLLDRRPGARVVATDLDGRAVACARSNGVDARGGDLLAPVPDALRGSVDVVVAVVPYVPTDELALLQRDTLVFESALAYDGGPDGMALLRRVVREGAPFLRPGGALLLELGGPQAQLLAPELAAAGFGRVDELRDDEGDVRGVEATLGSGTTSRACRARP